METHEESVTCFNLRRIGVDVVCSVTASGSILTHATRNFRNRASMNKRSLCFVCNEVGWKPNLEHKNPSTWWICAEGPVIEWRVFMALICTASNWMQVLPYGEGYAKHINLGNLIWSLSRKLSRCSTVAARKSEQPLQASNEPPPANSGVAALSSTGCVENGLRFHSLTSRNSGHTVRSEALSAVTIMRCYSVKWHE
jgi:hypothetical protein